jgi:hypothetical protein
LTYRRITLSVQRRRYPEAAPGRYSTIRFINTAGPNHPERRYTPPPLERFDLQETLLLVEQQNHFVLHPPRPTGKTACLLALRNYLNSNNVCRCVYSNVEVRRAPARAW